jgi:hypothetical protein
MNVTFTLTTLATAAGPFNISGTTSSDVTTSLATGITAEQLASGYTINSVNDAITGGTIASTGTCSGTTRSWSASTATPTPTPTLGPTLNLIVISSDGGGATGGPTACNNSLNNQYTFNVYSQFNYLVDGETLYLDNLASEVFIGYGHFYSDGNNFGKINNFGVYLDISPC